MRYQKTVLPNGIRVISESLPHFHTVSLGFWLQAGSRDEADFLSGTAHFLEHMAFKRTSRRNALTIAREIDQLGGAANAFTTKEHTCYHGKVLGDQLPHLFDLLSDLLLHPVYADEDLERERQVILQEIDDVEDTPEDYVHLLFGLCFWGDTPLGRPITGDTASVNRLQRQDLLKFRQIFYQPQQMLVAAAGQVEHQWLVDLVARNFGHLENQELPPGRLPVTVHQGIRLFPADLESVYLVQGVPAPAASSMERFPATLLNLILGGNMSSRLFQEVRENRGLCYSIYSFLHCFSDTGLLGLAASVSPKNFHPLLEVLQQEVDKLRRFPVTAEELQAALNYCRASMYLGAEDSDNRMIRLAKNELNFGAYLSYEEVLTRLAEVSAAELQQRALEWLAPERWQTVILGPVTAI